MAMDYHQIRIILEEMIDDGFLEDTLTYEPENETPDLEVPWFSPIAFTLLVQAAGNAVACYERSGTGTSICQRHVSTPPRIRNRS